MAERSFYLQVGREPVRGPLPERAIRESWASGVLSDDARVGETPDDLAPIAERLGPRAPGVGSFGPAAAFAPPKRSMLPFVLGAVVVLLLVAGAGAGGFYAYRHRAPTLCKATPHVLASLHNDLDIRLYVTRRPKKLAEAADGLERLLAAMKKESHGRMTYRVVEVKDDETRLQAKDDGLQEQMFGEAKDEGADISRGFFGVALRYGAEKDRIPVLTPETDTQSAEFWLINKIREITAKADGKKQRIGVLVGHHEVALGDPDLVPHQGANIRGVLTQYFPFYSLVDVDLRGGSAPVPDDLEGLLVVGPSDALSEAELRRLDEHVMRGKPLAIFAGAATPKGGDVHMHVTLSTRGLERLTAAYGLELGNDLVFDDARAFKTRVMTTTGTSELRWGYIPLVKEKEGLDTASPVFFRLSELAFPLPSSITLRPERQPQAKLRALARTGATAVRDGRADVALEPQRPEKGGGAAGETILAASAEGSLKSAFGGAPSAKPARVLLVASSLFFTNPFVYASREPSMGQMGMMPATTDEGLDTLAGPYAQQVLTTTILVAKNTLDWLTFDDDLGGCLPQAGDKKK